VEITFMELAAYKLISVFISDFEFLCIFLNLRSMLIRNWTNKGMQVAAV
jgi:hypothetical protein